ncbi:MAG: aminoacyl-tRNA hydrolase [Methylococcaceae bacterium]|nr:MAG: aminoacyl-tRNA hydrolase [Methylococcaceae bacterium]
MSLRLIVGLGNPTAQYEKTRHNAGFWFMDCLSEREGLRFAHEPAMHGELAQWRVGLDTIYLLKPLTYMNRSGMAVQAVMAYYKIAMDGLMVVHDELEFAPGVARLKKGGGHGGHNGLRDIFSHVGPAFLRLRLGIGHPGDRSLVLGYVLDRPCLNDRQVIDAAIDRSMAILPCLVTGDEQRAMNLLNTKTVV